MRNCSRILSCLLLSALTACSAADPDTAAAVTDTQASDTAQTQVQTTAPVSEPDDGEQEQIKATVVFDGETMDINGQGASAYGGTLMITQGGTYELTGSFTGQIIVDISKDEEAELILNSVNVTAPAKLGSALWVKNADKVTLRLKKGTENTFTDDTAYGSGDTDACIYAEDDLTIKGNGTLIVCGNCKNGIYSRNDIKIKKGTVKVDAVNDGIKGKGSVTAEGGDITVVCSGDGISSGSDKEGKGFVLLSGADVNITAGTADSSAKGVKAANAIDITGGNITINSTDDAIHSDKTVSSDGGTLSVITGGKGICAGTTVTLNGGEGIISESYEGIEGASVTINGGVWDITAKDDGINATNGSGDDMPFTMGGGGFPPDMGEGFAPPDFGDKPDFENKSDFPGAGDSPTPPDGFPGMDEQSAVEDGLTGDVYILVTGGKVSINAGGDGVDSNGYIKVTGGEMSVDGPLDDGNAPLDYDGVFALEGGTLYAAGSSGMAQTVSSSVQGVLSVYFTEKQSAGTHISLKNSSGEAVGYTPSKQFSYITLSTEGLEGEYTLCSDDKELCTVNVSGIVCINEKGETVQPFMGFGRMR